MTIEQPQPSEKARELVRDHSNAALAYRGSSHPINDDSSYARPFFSTQDDLIAYIAGLEADCRDLQYLLRDEAQRRDPTGRPINMPILHSGDVTSIDRTK